MDKRWTAKVTDVRQWFTFSASERWRETTGSMNTIPIPAASREVRRKSLRTPCWERAWLTRFGLDGETPRTRSFRFVIIDEAFGRGSDESARYGLELFGRLDLQLLIVTPLQKIHIIEPYISAVGFVHNEDGRLSMLRNLTIEEYRAERAARTG